MLKAENTKPRVVFRKPQPVIRPSDAELNALAKGLNSATKITILGGAGAHEELITVPEKLKAPIVHALRGESAGIIAAPFDHGGTSGWF